MEDQVWLDKAEEAREEGLVEQERVDELLSKIGKDEATSAEQSAKDIVSTIRIKVTFVMDVPKEFLKNFSNNVSFIRSRIDETAYELDGIVRSVDIE